jgi:hypothetical protein
MYNSGTRIGLGLREKAITATPAGCRKPLLPSHWKRSEAIQQVAEKKTSRLRQVHASTGSAETENQKLLQPIIRSP